MTTTTTAGGGGRPPTKHPRSPIVSPHVAMVELKHRIVASLAKLSDRDTYQIAADDLEKIIHTSPPETFPTVLNALLHDAPASVAAKRECLRLLALLCGIHPDAAASHLPKIVSHVVRRVKDSSSDSSVRESCRETVGALSTIYLGTVNDPVGESYAPVVAMFVKPFLDAMSEQNKGAQTGAALCLAKIVECSVGEGAGGGQERSAAVGLAFQKLVPRICKMLGGQSFLSKAALLTVASSLAQIRAITSQGMQTLLQSIRECLESSDWATRKAAADTLSVLASTSSHLIGEGAASMITAIEACRFDKVKPVRDSVTEAALLWKKIGGKEGNNSLEETKSLNSDHKSSTDPVENLDARDSKPTKTLESTEKTLSDDSSSANPVSDDRSAGITEKAVNLLRKKVPSLNDKELNPEFFQKLEAQGSDDFPVEVVLPRKCPQQSHLQGGGELMSKDVNSQGISSQDDTSQGTSKNVNFSKQKRSSMYDKAQEIDGFARDKWTEQKIFKGSPKLRIDNDDVVNAGQKDPSVHASPSRTDIHPDSSLVNKGNWQTIQRQLSQLERQQANLMNMLQDFMGGSHDSMITLENRVRGLERVVEEMARDLAVSGRRNGSMFEGSPGRVSGKYNGFSDYSNSKFSRAGNGRMPYTERYLASDSMRGRDPHWRSDSDAWDSFEYGAPRNGPLCSRRNQVGPSVDGRLSRTDHDGGEFGSRRGWEKGSGPFRLGEGPSARSVWQASKDEATLQAIRVAGEDNGTHRTPPKKAIPELDADGLNEDNNCTRENEPLWASWTLAMDSLHVGDIDTAYAEIFSTGDDLLLVKLMDKSGPALDQLSNELANEALHAIGQFLLELNLHEIAFAWIQQLIDMVMENGSDYLSVPNESKKDILLGLRDASFVEPPEDWEGATAEQMMMQLASLWKVNMQHLVN